MGRKRALDVSPPVRPIDHFGIAGRIHDICLLVGRHPAVAKSVYGHLHKPGLEHLASSLGIAVHFNSHHQRLEGTSDRAGSGQLVDDDPYFGIRSDR